MDFPEPVISVAIEPKTKDDQDKLGKALGSLSEEDPTFRSAPTRRPARRSSRGMGELHLEILVDRMMREFKVEANVGKPQVAYRETITAAGREGRGPLRPPDRRSWPVRPRRHRPRAHRPRRRLRVRRQDHGGVIPREYIPAVDAGIQEALEGGVLAGYPLVDVRADLIDGSYHDVDSSEMAFKIAGSMALKDAARKAKPVLLEPVMAVEVVTPEDYMGDVIGDLNSRRGQVEGMEQRGNVAGDQRQGAAGRDVRLC